MKKINLIIPLGVLFLASCGNGNTQNNNAATPTLTPPVVINPATVGGDINEDTNETIETLNVEESNNLNINSFQMPGERLYMLEEPGIVYKNPERPEINGSIEIVLHEGSTIYYSDHFEVYLIRTPITISNLSYNPTSINFEHLLWTVYNPTSLYNSANAGFGRVGGSPITHGARAGQPGSSTFGRHEDVNTFKLIFPEGVLGNSVFHNTILEPNEVRETYIYIPYYSPGEYQLSVRWRGNAMYTAAIFSIYADF